MQETKDFLNQLKKLDCLIQNKLIEKEQWRSMALGTTSHSDGERVQSSSSQQKMADAVARYVDIEHEIDAVIDKLVDKKLEVISVLEQLDTVEYDFMHKVYVQYLTLQDVADLYGNSFSWARGIHGKALKQVKEILEERKSHE